MPPSVNGYDDEPHMKGKLCMFRATTILAQRQKAEYLFGTRSQGLVEDIL